MRDDAALLGLDRVGDGRFRFVVADHLARLDGRLYGGTAIAASLVAAELVSDRRPLWMTTQFVSTVAEGALVDMVAELLAPGRRTNQVRVTGTTEDGVTIFASLGATGHLRDEGLTGDLVTCPQVSRPEDAQPWASPFAGMARLAGIEDAPGSLAQRGFTQLVEMRQAQLLEEADQGPGRICLWIRRRDRAPLTPAVAAFAADMVPMSVAMAFGVVAGGTSLDNTIAQNRTKRRKSPAQRVTVPPRPLHSHSSGDLPPRLASGSVAGWSRVPLLPPAGHRTSIVIVPLGWRVQTPSIVPGEVNVCWRRCPGATV